MIGSGASPAPVLVRADLREEWIDENDHLNSAMYFVAFRPAVSALFHAAGLDSAYVACTGFSLVQREAHIRYQRELRRGSPLLMRAWVAAIDQRSVHVVADMLHGDLGWQAASVELLYTFFDRRERRSIAWPTAIAEGLEAQRLAGESSLPPEYVGRRVAVRPSGANPLRS